MECNFSLKSYLWFQIKLALHARSILKWRVWFQTKLHSTQFNYHYIHVGAITVEELDKQFPVGNYTKSRWPNTVLVSALANATQHVHKHCIKTDIASMIILLSQCPRYLYYFSSQMNTMHLMVLLFHYKGMLEKVTM